MHAVHSEYLDWKIHAAASCKNYQHYHTRSYKVIQVFTIITFFHGHDPTFPGLATLQIYRATPSPRSLICIAAEVHNYFQSAHYSICLQRGSSPAGTAAAKQTSAAAVSAAANLKAKLKPTADGSCTRIWCCSGATATPATPTEPE